MHFFVAWEIEAKGSRAEEIDKKMRQCLREFNWVRPLGDLYIVKVRSSKQWEKVNDDLSEVANHYGNAQISFIIGPLMKGGRYDGLLPGDIWESINEITG
jgi:hypothetical protein